jgi:uncharacterized protein (DUF1697 family)
VLRGAVLLRTRVITCAGMAATKRASRSPNHYVALIRGINVGGNNIIPMRDLAATFERLGLTAVRTYIQSGNVLFQSDEGDARALEKRIEAGMKKAHRCETKVVVRSSAEMKALLRSLPESWAVPDPATRYYVLFLRHGIDSKDILAGLSPKPDIEEVTYRPGALLWSASIAELTRTAIGKLASKPIYKDMTVRNLNTTLKLCKLLAASEAEGDGAR